MPYFRIEAVHLFARCRIDNAAILPMTGQIGQYEPRPVRIADNAEIQIGPVEATDKNPFFPESQELLHILFYLFRRRCRKSRYHWPPGQGFHPGTDRTIAGPEIVSPLGNTMGLINDYQGNRLGLHKRRKKLILQPFR